MEVEEIYGNLPILETERLILRKVTEADTEAIFEYGSSEEVTRHVLWNRHVTVDDTKAFMDYIQKRYKEKQVAPWGMEYKENGNFIGTIDFVWWKPEHKVAEIGYVLSSDYWGKGLTTEAAKEIIQFGFKQMDLIRIQAKCFSENIASERVMQKCGMSLEGTMRKAMFIKGKHQDLKMYSIVKDE